MMRNEVAAPEDWQMREPTIRSLVDMVRGPSNEESHSALYQLCAIAAEVVLERIRLTAQSFALILSAQPAKPADSFDPMGSALATLALLLTEAAKDFDADSVGACRLPTFVEEAELFNKFHAAFERDDSSWDLQPVSKAFGHVLSHGEQTTIEHFRIECSRILDMFARIRREEGKHQPPEITRLSNELSVFANVAFSFLQRSDVLRDPTTVVALLQDSKVKEKIHHWGLCSGLAIQSLSSEQLPLLRQLSMSGLLIVEDHQYLLRRDLSALLEGPQPSPAEQARGRSPTDQEPVLSTALHGGKLSLIDGDADHQRLAEQCLRNL